MYVRHWLTAVAFGLALTYGAPAQEPSPELPVEPSATQEQPSEQPAIEAEPVAPAVPTEPPRAQHDAAAALDRGGDAGENSYLIFGDGWAQWVMAFTGVGAFILSAWAVWLLRNTLIETRKANEAATLGAKAALAAVEAERPWLFVQGVDTGHHVDSTIAERTIPRTIEVSIRWQNTGRSPALGVGLMRSYMMTKDKAEVPIFSYDFSANKYSSVVVPPGGEIRPSAIGPLSEGDFRDVISGISKLYVFTAATYTMVGTTTRFTSTFCCRMDVIGLQANGEPLILYVPVGQQNTAT